MSDNVVIVTNENFENEVLKSEIPVLVDFWAEWCGPCKVVGPIIDQLAEEFKGKVKFAKVDVHEVSDVPEKYSILSIPTLILFNKGEIVDKVIGSRSKGEFKDFLNKNL